MKKILIAGAGSYIGTSFEKYLPQYPGEYDIETIDMQDGNWRDKPFAGFDALFHVAGIAHADTGRASSDTKKLYYSVNCDLAVETALKAKNDGVPHFIFMSSIIVYGSKNAVIAKDTVPQPDSFYGDSKLQADIKLAELADGTFKVALLRPPMVYGSGCKGNFPRLVSLARKLPLFPDYPNRRSMIYIENLCCFIKHVIDNGLHGIFMPQNEKHVNTTELVLRIASAHGKKIKTTKIFNPAISVLRKRTGTIGKLFGDLTYEPAGDEDKYNAVNFEESIRRSVGDTG